MSIPGLTGIRGGITQNVRTLATRGGGRLPANISGVRNNDQTPETGAASANNAVSTPSASPSFFQRLASFFTGSRAVNTQPATFHAAPNQANDAQSADSTSTTPALKPLTKNAAQIWIKSLGDANSETIIDASGKTIVGLINNQENGASLPESKTTILKYAERELKFQQKELNWAEKKIDAGQKNNNEQFVTSGQKMESRAKAKIAALEQIIQACGADATTLEPNAPAAEVKDVGFSSPSQVASQKPLSFEAANVWVQSITTSKTPELIKSTSEAIVNLMKNPDHSASLSESKETLLEMAETELENIQEFDLVLAESKIKRGGKNERADVTASGIKLKERAEAKIAALEKIIDACKTTQSTL